MGWDHGYHSREHYTAHFHGEMAPNWLDFAALVKGLVPPRHREGAPFRYLELGSGMGFGLCLLAALYPEGRFTGVDFQPDHIAHGRHLVEVLGLENLHFLEGDFLDLREDPSPLGFAAGESGIYHYVAAHGIATWVVEPVQQALLALASAALRPGGLFYCSYNTLPGWLPLTAYQQLAWLELERGDPALPGQALERAATTLRDLLGEREKPSPLASLLPSLGREVDGLRFDIPNYLLGEYANAGWQPLYVAEMHRRAASHKLRPVATATLPELFEELLPEPLRSQVHQEPNPTVRETLIDLSCGRGFRRDLFARGCTRLSGDAWRRRLGGLRLRRREMPPRQNWTFATSFGSLSVPAPICIGVEEALANGPRTVLELAEAIQQPAVEVVRLAALLLREQRLGLDRGEAGEQARSTCDRVNGRLLQRMGEGWPYGSLAAPRVGSGLQCNTLEALCCLAPGQGPLGPADGRWLQQRLEELGGQLRDGDGQPLKESYDSPEDVLNLASAFQRDRSAALQELGVFLARFQPRSPGHGEFP